MKNIYEEMINAGVVCSSHCSDLYVPVNAITTEIISRYDFKCNVTRFISQIEKVPFYDIPFAYTPYWEHKQKGGL